MYSIKGNKLSDSLKNIYTKLLKKAVGSMNAPIDLRRKIWGRPNIWCDSSWTVSNVFYHCSHRCLWLTNNQPVTGLNTANKEIFFVADENTQPMIVKNSHNIWSKRILLNTIISQESKIDCVQEFFFFFFNLLSKLVSMINISC